MTTRERFAALVARPQPPLAECCFVIAEHLGCATTADDGLADLRDLATSVGRSLELVAAPLTIDAVARHLFAELGFGGDQVTYYDRRNSLLPEVLRRRTGIPITLSIVVIEVAGALGITATGVGMPGHFLVGDGATPMRWLDCFDGGAWLDERGAQERFRRIHGPGATFDPAFLRPTPPTQIVARVLGNLSAIERHAGDPTALLRVLELLDDIPGVGMGPRDRVELAEAYVGVGRAADAVAVLQDLLTRIDPRRRPALESRIAQLRAGLN